MGPGCEQLAYVAANPQTPPSRPHHCEDPPVLPSVKGSPFMDGRTGGRPPRDGFCPSRGWPISGQDSGSRRRTQSPPLQASLGAICPTLELSGQVPRVPGVLSGETEALPAIQRTALFPFDHTSQQLSHPRRGRMPREDLGTGGCGRGSPWFPARSRGPLRVGPKLTEGFFLGDSGLSPAWEGVRVLLWLKLSHPAPRLQICTQRLPLSKSGLNYGRKDCDRCNLSPP